MKLSVLSILIAASTISFAAFGGVTVECESVTSGKIRYQGPANAIEVLKYDRRQTLTVEGRTPHQIHNGMSSYRGFGAEQGPNAEYAGLNVELGGEVRYLLIGVSQCKEAGASTSLDIWSFVTPTAPIETIENCRCI